METEVKMTSRNATQTTLRAMMTLGLLAALAATARATPEDDVLAAMNQWAATYASATTAEPMVALYTPDAVFWGTSGREPFRGPDEFGPYFAAQFDQFSGRTVVFHDPQIRTYGGIFATSTGTYEFDVGLAGGERLQAELRYSFALVNVDGRWLIAQHHSSSMPPP